MPVLHDEAAEKSEVQRLEEARADVLGFYRKYVNTCEQYDEQHANDGQAYPELTRAARQTRAMLLHTPEELKFRLMDSADIYKPVMRAGIGELTRDVAARVSAGVPREDIFMQHLEAVRNYYISTPGYAEEN